MPEDVAQTGALCRSVAVTEANWNDLAVNRGFWIPHKKAADPHATWVCATGWDSTPL